MFDSKCLLLCLWFFVGSHATGNLVPFIDKCLWSDKSCLVTSAQKAVPAFCDGMPELGVPPMDPLKLSKAKVNEGDLKVVFTDMDVTGTRQIKVLKVERDINKNTLKIVVECPIDVVGQYDASGSLLFTPINGTGAFRVNCQLVEIEVNVNLNPVDGPDGLKHWKISKTKYSYDAKKQCKFDFKNLENGETVLAVLNASWKEIIHSIGQPIVKAIVLKAVDQVQTFCDAVPTDQLEIQ
ncbi:hypothetical protein PYW08_003145 [Mythimna loreyi]|uniref:Uncharacterized protein n=1 Tax=Mythimna loreyi TaxID=667449 RepID=A0ACC2QQF5_9NEOP|nr:hypothetical protein PYW08_003145 [Mythimna loreyi]